MKLYRASLLAAAVLSSALPFSAMANTGGYYSDSGASAAMAKAFASSEQPLRAHSAMEQSVMKLSPHLQDDHSAALNGGESAAMTTLFVRLDQSLAWVNGNVAPSLASQRQPLVTMCTGESAAMAENFARLEQPLKHGLHMAATPPRHAPMIAMIR